MLLHFEVIATDGDLVDCAALFALVPHDLRNLGRINRRTSAARRSRGLRFYMTDEVQCWFDVLGEVSRFSHSMNVHVIDVWLIPEEMIVKRCYIDSVVQKGRHDWINFVLK